MKLILAVHKKEIYYIAKAFTPYIIINVILERFKPWKILIPFNYLSLFFQPRKCNNEITRKEGIRK